MLVPNPSQSYHIFKFQQFAYNYIACTNFIINSDLPTFDFKISFSLNFDSCGIRDLELVVTSCGLQTSKHYNYRYFDKLKMRPSINQRLNSKLLKSGIQVIKFLSRPKSEFCMLKSFILNITTKS